MKNKKLTSKLVSCSCCFISKLKQISEINKEKSMGQKRVLQSVILYQNHCKNTCDSRKAVTERGHNDTVVKTCFKLTDDYKDLITLSGRSAPRDGAYVHGMYMEGARWDIQQGVILDSRLKELFPHMPVINIRVRFTTHPYQGLPSKLCHYVLLPLCR